jgi:hypothetical protein
MVGETGDRNRDADVTAADFVRTALAVFSNPASIRNRFDHNRDGRVTVTDLAVVRRNLLTPPLRLITAPAAAPPRMFNDGARIRDSAGATTVLRDDV